MSAKTKFSCFLLGLPAQGISSGSEDVVKFEANEAMT